MKKLKCPIYNSYNACAAHPDCAFLRTDNCAVLVSASLAEENAKEVQRLSKKMDAMDDNIRQFINAFQQITSKQGSQQTPGKAAVKTQ